MNLSYAFVMKCSNGQQNIQFNSVAYFNYILQFIFLEYFFTKKNQKKIKHDILMYSNSMFSFILLKICQLVIYSGYLVLFVTFRYLLMPASLENLIFDVLSLNWDSFLSMICSVGG